MRVAILTGASSGIGRATARELARRGYAIALAARREHLLLDAAAEVEELGGRAIAVETDVTDEEAVEALVNRTLAELGRIDVFVGNAGVYQLGRFEDTPPDVFRRVLETNFFGIVNGARAVIPAFRRQGHGTLVLVASLDSHVGAAQAAAYTASKWAVRGFAASLRSELRGSGVHISVVSPASIDTPLFRHAANYTGRAMKALSPVYAPERVASAIARVAERPRREVIVGPMGVVMAVQRTLTPALVDRLFGIQVEHDHFTGGSAPASPGNLFEPVDDGGSASGGFGGRRHTRLRRAALVAAASGAAAATWRART